MKDVGQKIRSPHHEKIAKEERRVEVNTLLEDMLKHALLPIS
jgi:hypothetical protein